MTDISIIIVNYNTAEMLRRCIDSIRQHVRQMEYEVIVVDNHSTEGNLEDLASDPTLRWIPLADNLGFGQANNAGAQMAQGRYLLFLNPDTYLTADSVSYMGQYLDEHPTVGICGCNLLDAQGQPAHSFHRQLPSFWTELDMVLSQCFGRLCYGRNLQYNHSHAPLEVALITGADLMIRREVWQQTGGFDPAYFMYYEDTDLCQRVRQLGYGIVCLPECPIVHLEGQSFSYSKHRAERIFRGRRTYFAKHYGKNYNRLTDAMNLLTIRLGIVVCALCGRRDKKQILCDRLHIYKQTV